MMTAVGLAGCGTARHGVLVWVRTPQVFVPGDLPTDRILVGRIRNTSHHTLSLRADALAVDDAHGRALKSSAGFTAAYAHGLYGAFQKPSAEPLRELVRLGRIVTLDPGASCPLFAAWRVPAGDHARVSIDYGSGRLTVPPSTRPTAR
jgi:hypothetical protein